MNERLLSVLIGLARATEGNVELMTEKTGHLLFQGLSMLFLNEPEEGSGADVNEQTHRLNELLENIREEKKRLVPNCFECASPCGRTADYDMREFWDTEKEQIDLKLVLVRRLAKRAAEVMQQETTSVERRDNCLKALIVLGWNGSRESLLRVLDKL